MAKALCPGRLPPTSRRRAIRNGGATCPSMQEDTSIGRLGCASASLLLPCRSHGRHTSRRAEAARTAPSRTGVAHTRRRLRQRSARHRRRWRSNRPDERSKCTCRRVDGRRSSRYFDCAAVVSSYQGTCTERLEAAYASFCARDLDWTADISRRRRSGVLCCYTGHQVLTLLHQK